MVDVSAYRDDDQYFRSGVGFAEEMLDDTVLLP